jgi:hypothetical protein
MIKNFLQSHRDYMHTTFRNMSIVDAKRYADFIETLYLTEAYLVRKTNALKVQEEK